MSRFGLNKRRVVITAISAVAVLGGGVGIAAAATSGDQGEQPPTYHSSVTTTATESGSEAAQNLALSKLATITLPDAARAADQAVPGGTVIGIDLGNEGGNVVYTAEVVTAQGLSEVVVDAGNGHVLAGHPVTDQGEQDQGTDQGN